jgi:hypothetical protein
MDNLRRTSLFIPIKRAGYKHDRFNFVQICRDVNKFAATSYVALSILPASPLKLRLEGEVKRNIVELIQLARRSLTAEQKNARFGDKQILFNKILCKFERWSTRTAEFLQLSTHGTGC